MSLHIYYNRAYVSSAIDNFNNTNSRLLRLPKQKQIEIKLQTHDRKYPDNKNNYFLSQKLKQKFS